MLSFLFEQYGYYPNEISDNVFYVNKWKFELIEVIEEDNEIEMIEQYLQLIRETFPNSGIYIIKTRFGKLVSYYDSKKYVLVSALETNLQIKDLNKFHCSFLETEKSLDLVNLFRSWNEKMEYMEGNAINSIRRDSVYYEKNISSVMFNLGLAQNALQYLSEIIEDYGEIIKDVCLTHKRISDLNSFDFFNPFNFVVDHPIRDIAQLYKHDFLSFDDFVDLLSYYNLDEKVASFFMARLLFPENVFDQLEKNILKKEKDFKLDYNIEKEMQKIKKAYAYLKNKYNIRPIDWL